MVFGHLRRPITACQRLSASGHGWGAVEAVLEPLDDDLALCPARSDGSVVRIAATAE